MNDDDKNHAAEKNHNKNNNYNKKTRCEGRTEEVREKQEKMTSKFLLLCIHKTFLITLMHLFLSKKPS